MSHPVKVELENECG